MNVGGIDPRPFWIRWKSRDWAFLLLQIFLGLRFLAAGLGKFNGPNGLSFQHFYSQVMPALSQPFLEKTILPAWTVQLFLGTLPYGEILLGAGILVAGKNRGPLVLAGLLYISLAFGQMLIGGQTTVADIAIHLGLVVAALLLVGDEPTATTAR
jgi:thiosulfate dehydrogenase [quinone] large subunit